MGQICLYDGQSKINIYLNQFIKILKENRFIILQLPEKKNMIEAKLYKLNIVQARKDIFCSEATL